jgi:hypothetical protein
MDAAQKTLTSAIARMPRRGTQEQAEFVKSLDEVSTAAGNLRDSGDSDVENKKFALDAAVNQADIARMQVEQASNDAAAKAMLDTHDRQGEWVATVRLWVDEKEKVLGPRKKLADFVAIVKKHRLARSGFAPFNSYVKSFWPDNPEEFFAESFATWRSNPDYMKKNARPLFDWFEKGGHLEPRAPKLPSYKEVRKAMKQVAPDLDDALTVAEGTFGPLLQEARDMIVTLGGGKD